MAAAAATAPVLLLSVVVVSTESLVPSLRLMMGVMDLPRLLLLLESSSSSSASRRQLLFSPSRLSPAADEWSVPLPLPTTTVESFVVTAVVAATAAAASAPLLLAACMGVTIAASMTAAAAATAALLVVAAIAIAALLVGASRLLSESDASGVVAFSSPSVEVVAVVCVVFSSMRGSCEVESLEMKLESPSCKTPAESAAAGLVFSFSDSVAVLLPALRPTVPEF